MRIDLLAFAQILGFTVTVLALHAMITVYLMQVLNDAFDPDWHPRMLFPPGGFWDRYRWTHHYSGAVLFRRVRRTVFENIPYDFRARVTRTTVALCVFHQLCALVALVGMAALVIVAAYGLWWLWQNRPRIVPSILRPEGVPEIE